MSSVDTINDVKYRYLCDYFSYGYSDGYFIVDLEYEWLADLTSQGDPNTLQDLWELYLVSEGHTTGTFNDKLTAFLIAAGHSGNLNDMLFDFWAAGVASTFEDFQDVDGTDFQDVDAVQLQVK